VYLDYTGCGNSLNVRQPARAAADHGLAAVTGSWTCTSTGFRFDLARPWPASCTREPAGGVLRPGAAGPGGIPRSSSSPSLGTWPGRLPGRQVPAAVDGVERQVTGTRCATSGAASPRRCPSSASRLTGSSDLYETSGRGPVASSTSSPATMGSRSGCLVSYDASTNEANGDFNRDGSDDNRSVELRGEARRTIPRSTSCGPRQVRNFLVTLFCSQGVPMLLAGDEMGRSSAATTTPTARTTRSRGWTGRPRASSRPDRFHPRPLSGLRGRTRCSAAAGSSAGSPRPPAAAGCARTSYC